MYQVGQQVIDLVTNKRVTIVEMVVTEAGPFWGAAKTFYKVDPPSISDDYPNGTRTQYEIVAPHDMDLEAKLAMGAKLGFANLHPTPKG